MSIRRNPVFLEMVTDVSARAFSGAVITYVYAAAAETESVTRLYELRRSRNPVKAKANVYEKASVKIFFTEAFSRHCFL